jgi:hypothetical protein
VGTKTFTLPAGTAKDKAGNSSLEVTKSYSVIEDTEEPVKWSGLGMGLFSTSNTSLLDGYVDTLLSKGFTELRIDIPDYSDSGYLAQSKAAVIRTVAKGADVIWGVGAGNITAANWANYRQGILDAATWAQANGVFEFQLGNELESHNDNTTLTDAQLIVNLKSVATDVQAIFTNGNVSYTCFEPNINDWIAAGKGNIDILATNLYMGGGGSYGDSYKGIIDNLIDAFGVDGTYLTEFGPSWSSLDDYSTDEAVQATVVANMLDYIKASGMTRASYFCYRDATWLSGFGVLKDDGTYRLLWNQALLNTGTVKFATVPTKTATISLPNTIALIPK